MVLICYSIAPVTEMGLKGLKLFLLCVLMPFFTREEEDAMKFFRYISYEQKHKLMMSNNTSTPSANSSPVVLGEFVFHSVTFSQADFEMQNTAQFWVPED